MAGIYAFLGVVAGGSVILLRGNPLEYPEPWIELSPLASHSYSALVGVTLGIGLAVITPLLVARTKWAKTLQDELRPWAQGLSGHAIFWLALLSSFAEELLFRSLLQPTTNLWVGAISFGLLHQVPGPARWIWVTWATIMGVVLGSLYAATGSLVGPLLAHALLNGMNLRHLRAHDDRPATRALGGILGPVHPR